MFRNLILLIAVGVVIWLLSQFFKNKSISQARKQKGIKNIVQCQICGVYIPDDQALKHNDHFFCSSQHLQEWKEQQ